MNKFFSNILKNLGIPVYDNFDLIIENVKDPAFKAILKYKNYPSIYAIRNTLKNSIFCFKEVTIEEIEKEINRLSSKKAYQNSDIPTRIVKENADFFADFLCKSINVH